MTGGWSERKSCKTNSPTFDCEAESPHSSPERIEMVERDGRGLENPHCIDRVVVGGLH